MATSEDPRLVVLIASFLIWAGLIAKTPAALAWPQQAWAIDVLFFAVVPIVVFALAARRAKWSWTRTSGLELRPPARLTTKRTAMMFGFTVAIIAAYFVVALLVILPAQSLNSVFPPLLVGVKQSVAEAPVKWIALAYVVLTGSVVEEVVYRGMTAHYFLDRECPRIALYILITTLMFALGHIGRGLSGMVFAVAIGLLFSSLFAKSRILLPFILAHAVADYIHFR